MPAADPADHALAGELAQEAGQLLLQLRSEVPLNLTSEQTKELKDRGDRAAHEFLAQALQAARPDDAFLSEEGQADPARLSASRVWIVDPLDGTREYGEPPRDDWAVHVALVCDNQPVAGAVALPAQGVTLTTANASQLAPEPADPDSQPRVIASRSRPGPVPQALADALGAELILLGSAGAKAMEVVQGRADIYAHTGGQYEWDSAAPVAVAQAAGLHASRIDGSELRYNQPEVYLPDLLICHPAWAQQSLAIAAQALDQPAQS